MTFNVPPMIMEEYNRNRKEEKINYCLDKLDRYPADEIPYSTFQNICYQHNVDTNDVMDRMSKEVSFYG